MKTITKKWLEENDACSGAIRWVLSQKDKSIKSLFQQGLKDNKLEWLNWGITKLFNRKQIMQYAVYAAKQASPFYKKEYQDDKQLRQAINATIKCIKNDTKENRDTAWAAAWAAEAAARATAGAAAGAAAGDTAWAAEAAAWAAAWAAEAAARDTMMKKILKYGMRLLK